MGRDQSVGSKFNLDFLQKVREFHISFDYPLVIGIREKTSTGTEIQQKFIFQSVKQFPSTSFLKVQKFVTHKTIHYYLVAILTHNTIVEQLKHCGD